MSKQTILPPTRARTIPLSQEIEISPYQRKTGDFMSLAETLSQSAPNFHYRNLNQKNDKKSETISAASLQGSKPEQQDSSFVTVGVENIKNLGQFLENRFRQMVETVKNRNIKGGSTAATVHYNPKNGGITTANLGDSRVYLLLKNKFNDEYLTILLTEDHNPELERIKSQIDNKKNDNCWQIVVNKRLELLEYDQENSLANFLKKYKSLWVKTHDDEQYKQVKTVTELNDIINQPDNNDLFYITEDKIKKPLFYKKEKYFYSTSSLAMGGAIGDNDYSLIRKPDIGIFNINVLVTRAEYSKLIGDKNRIWEDLKIKIPHRISDIETRIAELKITKAGSNRQKQHNILTEILPLRRVDINSLDHLQKLKLMYLQDQYRSYEEIIDLSTKALAKSKEIEAVKEVIIERSKLIADPNINNTKLNHLEKIRVLRRKQAEFETKSPELLKSVQSEIDNRLKAMPESQYEITIGVFSDGLSNHNPALEQGHDAFARYSEDGKVSAIEYGTTSEFSKKLQNILKGARSNEMAGKIAAEAASADNSDNVTAVTFAIDENSTPTIAGVFDGHGEGGEKVSQYCIDYMDRSVAFAKENGEKNLEKYDDIISYSLLPVATNKIKSSKEETKKKVDANDASLQAFEAAIKKNENEPNPEGVYRGIGVKVEVVDCEYQVEIAGANEIKMEKSSGLKITNIFSPKITRFWEIDAHGNKTPGTLKINDIITDLYIRNEGEKLTDISIKEIFETKKEAALSFIAEFFHQNSEVSFKTADGKVHICDNRINKTALFSAKSDSGEKEFECLSEALANNPAQAKKAIDTSIGIKQIETLDASKSKNSATATGIKVKEKGGETRQQDDQKPKQPSPSPASKATSKEENSTSLWSRFKKMMMSSPQI